MCFPLFSCLKSWWKPGRLLASYYTLNFYKKSNMNLFKLVDKMHDKLLYSHYLHCTAFQCWQPGFPKAIYSTGNTSRKNLLFDASPIFYGPVILLHILKIIWWRNVVLGIMDHCDSNVDLVKYMWVSDLYFMVHWFYLMSLSDLNYFYTLRNGTGRGYLCPSGHLL